MSELRTEPLLLRRWHVSDRAPFAALNADPEVVQYEAPFTPAVEVGWRLARAAWGFGFVTEAARAAAAFAFDELDLDELVSYTAEPNVRSRAVMRRLGMRHDPGDDFDHPHFPEGDLRRHVLYRRTAPPQSPR